MIIFKRLFAGCLGAHTEIVDETTSIHLMRHESKATHRKAVFSLEASSNQIGIEPQNKHMSSKLYLQNPPDGSRMCAAMPQEEVPVEGDTWLPLDSSPRFSGSKIKQYDKHSQYMPSNPRVPNPKTAVMSHRSGREGQNARPTQLNKDIHNLQVQYEALKNAFDVLNMKKGAIQNQRLAIRQKSHAKARDYEREANQSSVMHEWQAVTPVQIASGSRSRHSFRTSKYEKGPKPVVRYVA